MNILEHHEPLLAGLFAQQTTVLQKGRYLKRWARRLRKYSMTWWYQRCQAKRQIIDDLGQNKTLN